MRVVGVAAAADRGRGLADGRAEILAASLFDAAASVANPGIPHSRSV